MSDIGSLGTIETLVCKKTIFDDPIKLIILVTVSLAIAYLSQLFVSWAVSDFHYKSRPLRSAALFGATTVALLLVVYFLGVDYALDVSLSSILMLVAVFLSMFSIVSLAQSQNFKAASILILCQVSAFAIFYGSVHNKT